MACSERHLYDSDRKQWHHADDVTDASSPVNQVLINRWSVARTLTEVCNDAFVFVFGRQSSELFPTCQTDI